MSDTYTTNVTPLEVPGAVREFAEQGVNQAR